MAIESPSLALAVPAMFANIKPVLNAVTRLGATDFSADAPTVDVKPGETVKVPVSSLAAAAEFGASNNYTTGGTTGWATLTAKHYLQGFDISGVNLDQGVDAAKLKQLFALRAGSGIAMAVQANLKAALNDLTAQSQITLTAISTSTEPTIDEYLGLADGVDFLDKSTAMLAVNGALLANIKKVFAADNIIGTPDELAQYMGFAGCVLVPGMTPRAVVVPTGSVGFLARVPQVIARYLEAGAQTDEDTGLSVGIVVADDQALNRQIVNADLWFGTVTQSAAYASSAWTPGAIRIA